MPQKIENLEKKIFYILAGSLLLLMPILSLNSGISGDEETFHYLHGKNVYKYYASLGKDTTCLHYNNSALHMYGPVFDVVTVVFIKILKPSDEYMVRHILNSMTGWAAIFFAALIAIMLGGWRAGIITLLFMFLSPRFLGHSFNNPKDIPFAAAYIFTIYGIIRFLKYFPENAYRYAWPIALGIGLTIGVRVGGILLAIYFLFFTGVFYVFTVKYKEWFLKENMLRLKKMLLYALVISIAGYIIGIILWPFAHKAPISKTIEALKYMENYETTLRQIFEGKVIWSDKTPLNYLPKYILITIPEFVILGFILFFILINKAKRQFSTWYFILLFTSIFPIFYVIYKGSNVYGEWRHVMFVYPGIVVIAALGTNSLIDRFKQKYIKWSVIAIFSALGLLPLIHIIKNHPLEYIYFNSISGGIQNAYGNYEMDYFYHSLRAGSEWLIKNKIEKANVLPGKKIIIATNHAKNLAYYFRKYTDKVNIVYIRYYQRGNVDWDYAVLANSYINPFHLKKKLWPPSNTIHTIDVDNKPVCAILERTDKNDLQGFLLSNERNYPEAIEHFKAAIAHDKNYDIMYANLAEAYLNMDEYDKAIEEASACLKLYPNFDKALDVIGLAYMNKQQFETALAVFMQDMRENPKNVLAFYNTALLYAQTKNYDIALKYLQKAIDIKPNYKQSYYLAARIYEVQGNAQLAKNYNDYANSLP
jgi:tetratricopeptide (TPR) repeat protein